MVVPEKSKNSRSYYKYLGGGGDKILKKLVENQTKCKTQLSDCNVQFLNTLFHFNS